MILKWIPESVIMNVLKISYSWPVSNFVLSSCLSWKARSSQSYGNVILYIIKLVMSKEEVPAEKLERAVEGRALYFLYAQEEILL